MTDRAVQSRPVDEHRSLRESDRSLFARLYQKAKRRIPFAGQLFWKHLRQHLPDPVRNTIERLASDGSIFEMFADVRVVDGPVGNLAVDEETARKQDQNQNDNQEDPLSSLSQRLTRAFDILNSHRSDVRGPR